MRKVITFLVAVALIGIFFISFGSASTIEKENSTGELVGMVIGALLAGIIGIVTVCFTQHREAKKTKKYIASALLSGVQVNQEELQGLINLVHEAEKFEKGNLFLVDIFPKELRFEKTLYSALADKIGLLDSKSKDNLVLYYRDISLLENLLKLSLIKENTELIKVLGKEVATKGHLMRVEEVYKRGEELIKSLKDQI